jgi:hypothetical protein
MYTYYAKYMTELMDGLWKECGVIPDTCPD